MLPYVLGGIAAAILILIVVLFVNTSRIGTKKTGEVQPVLPSQERVDICADKLSKMIQVDTVTAVTNEKIYAFHSVLKELYPNVFNTLEFTDIDDGAILLKWQGSKNTKNGILLMAHQDVVPATGDWQHPPFSGHIDENGIIWGRGAVDTKGSLAAFLQAVEELIEQGYVPENDVYLASSKNEETNGTGAPATVAYLQSKGVKLSLVLDEGGAIVDAPLPGLTGQFAMIGLIEKGYGAVKFTAKSNGGHASTPTQDTPIARIGKFVSYMDKKQPFNKEFTMPIEKMFTTLAPYMTGPLKVIMANLWLFKPLLIKVLPKFSAQAGAMLATTCAFTMCSGSDAENVIPEEATLTANLRYMLHEREEASIKKITEIAAKFDLKTEVLTSRDCSGVADITTGAYQTVVDTLGVTFPECGCAPYIMLQGSDSRNYEPVCDCVLKFAPLMITKQQMGSIHGINENVSAMAIARAVDFYKELILRYNGENK